MDGAHRPYWSARLAVPRRKCRGGWKPTAALANILDETTVPQRRVLTLFRAGRRRPPPCIRRPPLAKRYDAVKADGGTQRVKRDEATMPERRRAAPTLSSFNRPGRRGGKAPLSLLGS
ncbi:hypothetical protein KM043_002682 [Ampulex compressa]|nr:hypothetical protein KM043_002682 [Ampulex compressa]